MERFIKNNNKGDNIMKKSLITLLSLLILGLVGCSTNKEVEKIAEKEIVVYMDEEAYIQSSMDYLDDLDHILDELGLLFKDFSFTDRWKNKALFINERFTEALDKALLMKAPPELEEADRYQKLSVNEFQKFVHRFPSTIDEMLILEDFNGLEELSEYLARGGDYLQFAKVEVEKYKRRK